MEAFEILAEQYRPMLLTYLSTLTSDRHLAEDLTQETLLAAYKGLSGFRRGSSFGAWLRGIARNKMLESRRASARHPLVADSRIIEGMEEVYASLDAPRPDAEGWDERLAALRDCVERLSGKVRETVVEVYRNGRSLQDASSKLGVTFEATAQRLHRGRALLRDCLASRMTEGNAT